MRVYHYLALGRNKTNDVAEKVGGSSMALSMSYDLDNDSAFFRDSSQIILVTQFIKTHYSITVLPIGVLLLSVCRPIKVLAMLGSFFCPLAA